MLRRVTEAVKEFGKQITFYEKWKQGSRANQRRGERLLFVGGAPRSGTTLLQHVLDSHPKIFGGPEFDCIPSIIGLWRHLNGAWDRGRIRVYCSPAQIDAVFANLIEDLLLPVADAHQALILSEKTPFNVLVFTDLLELFPACRVVHIVRDPRAVVSSMLQVGARCREKQEPAPEFVQDIQRAVQFTRECLDAGFRAAAQYPERVSTLTYESLVTRPVSVVEGLCKFLGLPFVSEMLRPEAIKHPAQDELARLDRGTWLNPALGFREIEASRIDAWEEDLAPAEVHLVNDGFREHSGLRGLGYRFG